MTTPEPIHARLNNAVAPLSLELGLDDDAELRAAARHAVTTVAAIAQELSGGSTYDRVARLGTLVDRVDGTWCSTEGLRVWEPRPDGWRASWGRLCGGPGATPEEALRRLELELRDRARWLLDLPAQRDVEPEACSALEAVL